MVCGSLRWSAGSARSLKLSADPEASHFERFQGRRSWRRQPTLWANFPSPMHCWKDAPLGRDIPVRPFAGVSLVRSLARVGLERRGAESITHIGLVEDDAVGICVSAVDGLRTLNSPVPRSSVYAMSRHGGRSSMPSEDDPDRPLGLPDVARNPTRPGRRHHGRHQPASRSAARTLGIVDAPACGDTDDFVFHPPNERDAAGEKRGLREGPSAGRSRSPVPATHAAYQRSGPTTGHCCRNDRNSASRCRTTGPVRP